MAFSNSKSFRNAVAKTAPKFDERFLRQTIFTDKSCKIEYDEIKGYSYEGNVFIHDEFGRNLTNHFVRNGKLAIKFNRVGGDFTVPTEAIEEIVETAKVVEEFNSINY